MYIITKLIIFLQNKLALPAICFAIAFMINPAKGQSAGGAKDLIDLKVTNSNLSEVITLLKSQSAYEFFYDKEAAKRLNVNRLIFNRTPLLEVLQKIRKELPVEYEVLRNEVSIRIESAEKFNRRKAQEQPGKISGRIVDDKGEPLPGASVKIPELNHVFQSAADGTYQVGLEPGTYSIEVSYIGYQTKRITEVAVRPGENTRLDILMKADSKSLNGVVITASYKRASIEGLYARQKNNAAVSDGITAEQISRTPDNNTAQVLKRISGLQVSDGKFVVIRGLSDRYNNVLLNGAMLPSSEPNKRNFAFDMVPSAILDRIIVNKTATPDLTGEFTGGLVQIETKDIPDENFFQLTVGTGYNSQATGKEMLGLDRGKNAWRGASSNIHEKPTGMSFSAYSALEDQVSRATAADDPNRQQIHKYLSGMPENWVLKKYKAMPAQNYQLQLGQAIPFRDESRLGVIAALSYRNEQDIENRSLYSLRANDFSGLNNKYATTLGGSVNLGYQAGKHKFTLQNTYNRKFSDDMWKYTGVDGESNNLRHDSYTNVTIVNELLQSQLGGEHFFGVRNIKLDWLASAGQVNRDQPYSRVVARLNGDDQTNYPPDYLSIPLDDNRLKNGTLFYSELREKVYNWAANLQFPFRFLNLDQSFKAGYAGKYRKAAFGANLFRLHSFRDADYPMGTPYEQVFTRDNFGKDLYLHVVNAQGRERKDS